MALTVNTNTSANNALNSLNKTSRKLAKAFNHLSTGLRISSAADDAAGLGVAENLKVASASAKVAARNINDGISVISVAEGASAEVGDMLGRMRELAVQGASDTLDDDERAYIQSEYTSLAGEMDRVSAVTEFNGRALTDGTTATLNVQVGINATSNDQISLKMGDLTTATLGVDTGSVDMTTAGGCSSALASIDSAIDMVNGYRSDYGAAQNQLESALNTAETFAENTTAAESRIRDVDFGAETAELSKQQLLQQAGVAILGQAKSINQGAVQLLQG
jgi:flagellin